MNNITELPQPEERCEICKIRKAKRLCDYVVDEVWTSIDFQKHAITCDKKLCEKCAVRLGGETDFCPKHAAEARKRLGC